jgi:hypothetical protein
MLKTLSALLRRAYAKSKSAVVQIVGPKPPPTKPK